MTTPTQDPSRDHQRLNRLSLILAGFCLLLPVLGLLAPKAVVPLSLVTGLAAAAMVWGLARPWQLMNRSITLAVCLFVGWCLIASLWTPLPQEAAMLALRVAVLLLIMVFLCGAAGLMDTAQSRRAGFGLAAGVALAVVLVLIEFVFGFPVYTALKGPPANDYAAYSRLNRGITTLAILAWPLAALCWHLRFRPVAFAVPPAALALALSSQSSAAVLGLFAGLLAAALAGLGRRAGRLILAAAIVLPLAAGPGVAKLMKEAGLHEATYLSPTARYRVHTWDFVADKIVERPLAGWGFDSSASIPAADAEPFGRGRKAIPSHPHNGPLQILLELGAAGAVLTIAVLFFIARRIDGLPPAARVCSQGMFITILCIASTAYGLWQSHWLAVIGGAAVISVIVLPRSARDSLPRKAATDPPQPRPSAAHRDR
ncbi:O-antigen ligase [Pelagibius sp.]|uniref:O-antigen ligase family protein n=1 Tax=Pelagibius sp. TaxID=1931238 RepID=UPI0026383F9F|nr:O-antigen ligase family protein [Pelagibius sp.]